MEKPRTAIIPPMELDHHPVPSARRILKMYDAPSQNTTFETVSLILVSEDLMKSRKANIKN